MLLVVRICNVISVRFSGGLRAGSHGYGRWHSITIKHLFHVFTCMEAEWVNLITVITLSILGAYSKKSTRKQAKPQPLCDFRFVSHNRQRSFRLHMLFLLPLPFGRGTVILSEYHSTLLPPSPPTFPRFRVEDSYLSLVRQTDRPVLSPPICHWRPVTWEPYKA